MTEKTDRLLKIVSLLERDVKKYTPPLIDLLIEKYGKDPFLILIATLLSLRSRDIVTWIVVQELFLHAKTAEQLVNLERSVLEKIVFKTGFYRQKAATLQHVAKEILDRFHDIVPADKALLISITGVGLKTANLVLGMAFDQPAICVDVHVHRISNRLGLIKTKTVEETEQVLEKLLPKHLWIPWNNLIVVWGQNVCLPRNPKCNQCSLQPHCDQNI
ncbi:endonuclease III [Candidatus Babeliales bacterium]|nr:endonuclease III [Candidatus Babeliales bacterium]